MNITDEMHHLHSFKWDSSEAGLSSFILSPFCLSFFETSEHQTSLLNLVLGWYLHMSIFEEIYIATLCVLFRLVASQTHRGLLLGGSVPFNCYMWFLALCLFIAIVKLLACVPHFYKIYTKTILKSLVRGLWCYDNRFNIIDSFPLWRPYHVLCLSVARSPRRPYWLATLRFWHRETEWLSMHSSQEKIWDVCESDVFKKAHYLIKKLIL